MKPHKSEGEQLRKTEKWSEVLGGIFLWRYIVFEFRAIVLVGSITI